MYEDKAIKTKEAHYNDPDQESLRLVTGRVKHDHTAVKLDYKLNLWSAFSFPFLGFFIKLILASQCDGSYK